MNKNETPEKLEWVLDQLNEAYKNDPAAIQSLIQNRVPCNKKLANHQTVQVTQIATVKGQHYAVGALGLINSVLETILDEKIAVKFSEPDEFGVSKILGFCKYTGGAE